MRDTIANPIENTMTQMLLQSALDIQDKHNILATASEDVMVETTTRVGETYLWCSWHDPPAPGRLAGSVAWQPSGPLDLYDWPPCWVPPVGSLGQSGGGDPHPSFAGWICSPALYMMASRMI
uniref:Uncharacterized protein n=1 Tax=Eutreptiella gymnastica TaxID=73025 RepID=A0A6U8ACR1_9EUGL